MCVWSKICSRKEALHDLMSGGEDYVLNGIFASPRTRESSEIVKIKLLRLNPKSINLNLEEKQSEVIIETNVCDVLEPANPMDELVKAEKQRLDLANKQINETTQNLDSIDSKLARIQELYEKINIKK